MSMLPLISCGVGMGIVFLLIPLILRNRSRFAQRAPDLHHTHKTPIPRLGGLALAAAFLGVEAFVAVFFPEQGMARERWVVMGSSLAMFGLGLWDDLRPLGAKRKLLCQLLIAAVVCSFGIGIQTFKIPFTGTIIHLSAWGVLLTMLWLVAMTNLINLIDGVDGLAGGISLMLMALLAFVGYQHGFGLVACGMVGALLGFLWFNFPPAKIYLGDGGAYFLGFQIGLLTLVSSQKGTVVAALVAPLFVMALPIVDTTLAIVRRGLRGLPIFRPDRKHIHHRLMDMGLSRRKVVLSLYAVTLIFLGMGFTVFMSDGYWIPALLGLALLLMLLCAGRLSFSREWFSVGRVLGNSLSMRQDIQYALCLTRWLALEGGRHKSLEGLWTDLLFVTQRLGFSSVKLTLADGERVWEQQDVQVPVPMHVVQHQLQGGLCGSLELKVFSCQMDAVDSAYVSQTSEEDATSCRPDLMDVKLFEVVSELVAEGWVKAATVWRKGEQTALRFDGKAARAKSERPRRVLARVPMVPALQQG